MTFMSVEQFAQINTAGTEDFELVVTQEARKISAADRGFAGAVIDFS